MLYHFGCRKTWIRAMNDLRSMERSVLYALVSMVFLSWGGYVTVGQDTAPVLACEA